MPTGEHNAAKTACPRGHPYDAENTLYKGGARFCRECRRVYQREYMRRYRARLAARERP